jgi:hypothetical protein
MISEALDRALADTLYLHRKEALRSSVNLIERDALNMFSQQAWDCLLVFSFAELAESSSKDAKKAAVIMAAISAALRARMDHDTLILKPGLVAALSAALVHAGMAKYGITGTLESIAAEKWMAAHGAELVTGINDFTRQRMAAVLAEGLAAGDTAEGLAQRLMTYFDNLSIERARKIALTEASKAWSYAESQSAELMEEAGYIMVKEWLLGPMHPRFDICDHNNQAGAIPIHLTFPSGNMWTPAHPSCGCGVITYPDPYRKQPWGTPVLGSIPAIPFGDQQGDANAA